MENEKAFSKSIQHIGMCSRARHSITATLGTYGTHGNRGFIGKCLRTLFFPRLQACGTATKHSSSTQNRISPVHAKFDLIVFFYGGDINLCGI